MSGKAKKEIIYSIERFVEVVDENEWLVEDCLTTLLVTRVEDTSLTDCEIILEHSSASMLDDFCIT